MQIISPLVSVLGVTLIVGCIVALRKEAILEHWKILLGSILVFDVLGFALGYLASKALRQPESFCRTVAIEVGMQNSGLASTLGGRHFSPLTAVPGAIAAVYHCLLGSLIASVWRVNPPKDEIIPSDESQ